MGVWQLSCGISFPCEHCSWIGALSGEKCAAFVYHLIAV